MNMAVITVDELLRRLYDRKADPQENLALANEFVRQNPSDASAYYSRHNAWEHVGRRDKALADLDTSLGLEEHFETRCSRGELLRQLGRYPEAIADFNRGEALDPEAFRSGFMHLSRADCHARLGNKQAAMADCAKLADDHWTPNLFGVPGGTKAEIAAELRDIADAAQRERSQE